MADAPTPDFNEMMKMAQEMQKSMKEAHDDLSRQEYKGQAGTERDGRVEVVMDGRHQTKRVTIDPKLQDEDVKLIAELVAAANNAANRLIEKASEQKMMDLTKKLGLPTGAEGEGGEGAR